LDSSAVQGDIEDNQQALPKNPEAFQYKDGNQNSSIFNNLHSLSIWMQIVSKKSTPLVHAIKLENVLQQLKSWAPLVYNLKIC
jgi:hypothetical protein